MWTSLSEAIDQVGVDAIGIKGSGHQVPRADGERQTDEKQPHGDTQVRPQLARLELGRVVEQAEQAQLYGGARHPYTKALLSAAPIPDPAIERSRTRLKLSGELPSPMDPRAAFRFAPSRLSADPAAPGPPPALIEVAPGHLVAEFDPV